MINLLTRRNMKNFKFLSAFMLTISFNTFAVPEGAFTTLHVKAKDVDKYIELMKKNVAPFIAIGSDLAGVCVTKTGHQYPGEMFVWNAFPSVEKAFAAADLYDPMKASGLYKNIRKVKYSSTFKPLKEFNLQPAYERLWRLNLNNPMAYTQKMIELEEAIRAAGHNMNIGVFQPLGGGTEVFHVRAVSQSASELGKVVDDYFAGSSWSKIWDESAQYVDEIVSDTIEHCQIIYTK